ncbi:MAG: hypothetical protein ACI970_001692 [Myxococcota bacterium]
MRGGDLEATLTAWEDRCGAPSPCLHDLMGADPGKLLAMTQRAPTAPQFVEEIRDRWELILAAELARNHLRLID